MEKYCIIGTGRQGTAALYDLLLFSNASSILLIDSNQNSINNCLKLIDKSLLDKIKIYTEVVDINDKKKLCELLKTIDVFLSSVPYQYNLMLTEVALLSESSMVDLGGHTQNVIQQLQYNDEAENKGISIVPDCGMGPGMNVSMALLSMEQLDKAEDVYIWDGGLPQSPKPPWNYSLFFNIKGLTNEYDGSASFLKDGKVVEVECFEGFEIIDFDEVGKLEAVVTSGGLSTMPWTYENKLRTLENKTLRYAGHWNLMKAYRQLGLFDEKSISFKNSHFSPREFYHYLLEPHLTNNDRKDICIMRTEAYGLKNNIKSGVRFDVVEKFDNNSNLMAMEKWTGWHASIVMQKIMDGSIKTGAHPIEKALSGSEFYNEAIKRGYDIKKTIL